jgi:thymidylate synthase (FAD)
MDPLFRVETLSCTAYPNQLAYMAMHQDYSEHFVYNEIGRLQILLDDERSCGDKIVRHLLQGGKGHFGPLEHPSITLACGYFPHSVMQQARTHRVGISYDVQSMRYTGKRIVESDLRDSDMEELFYVRPAGHYHDRSGKSYFFTEEDRKYYKIKLRDSAWVYKTTTLAGHSEEHARGLLGFDFRQHFVVSFNMRSLMHFLDLRAKADAQLEIRQLCELMFQCFHSWSPEVAEWYKETRWSKARLSP